MLDDLLRIWWDIADPTAVFECREIVAAVAQCPRCGAEVELVAETDGWSEGGRLLGTKRVKWVHQTYGPAAAEHCGLLIADWWEGTFCYDLGGPETPAPHQRFP